MKRKHKTYSRPKRPFDKARIDEEAEIKKEYGLKNKTEIWKADAKIRLMRRKAKRLIGAEKEEQTALFERLKKMGLDVNSIGDILALDKKDYLNRRLQTIVAAKGLATTVKAARQMITHKKVLVDGKVVNSPSYVVLISKEDKITLKNPKKKEKKKVKASTKEAIEETAKEENKTEEKEE